MHPAIARAMLAVLLAHLVWAPAARAVSSSVVISQVYGGGGNSGATLRNDFIELFNRGTLPVDLSGWSIQYTSAAGSVWQRTNLAGSIQPGQYYLIQEAQGAGGTADLPPPDAFGTIPMGAASGKVALMSNQTLLTCGAFPGNCFPNAAIVDFVGYGSTTNNFEGPGPAPAPSNTTAILRASNGCTDTDDNAADFAIGTPNPRNTAAPLAPCTPFVPIHNVQGSGSTSPWVGQLVAVEGIVTARKLNGFFVQATDAEVDADPQTSEGIFVFTSASPPAAAAVGNRVQVTGHVAEMVPPSDPASPALTQLTQPTIFVLNTGNPLPVPVTISAAETSPGGSIEQLERFEGMRVQVASLTVVAPTEGIVNEALGTSTSSGVFFGVVTGIARPFREPGVQVPDPLPSGSPCCVPRFDANPERLRVDSDGQTGAAPIEVTTGSVVTALTGVLDYAFRAYTILPDPAPAPGVPNLGSAVRVRLAAPDEFTVAGFYLQRLFDTVDDPATSDAVLTPTAYDRRLGKLSLAIRDVMRSPDIVAVASAENLSVLQDLASRTNADAVAAGQANPAYASHLIEGNDPSGIDVGFMLKGARVAVVDAVQEGKTATFINPLTGQPELVYDSPPLVLRASVQPATGPAFPITAIAVHLRSMSGLGGDGDGVRFRAKRRAQAEHLANLLQARQGAIPGEAIAVVGDFNAFEFSDGYVDVLGTIAGDPTPANEVVLASPDLVNPNFVNLVEGVSNSSRYSFSFEGSAMALDHVLANAALAPRSRGLELARNGADFPDSFRNDPSRPERAADHDMPVAYFGITPVAVTPGGASLSGPVAIPNPARGSCDLRFSLAQGGEAHLAIYDIAGRFVVELARGPHAAGTHTVSWNARDAAGARVGAGLYFVRLATAGGVFPHRLVVLD